MKFKWLNNQKVQSEEGFIFQSAGRFCYHYIEQDHVMAIAVEPGTEYEELWLDSRNKWEPPHQCNQIANDELAKIRSNVDKALTFMGIQHRILKQE